MATPPARDVERSSGRRPTDRAVVRSHMARHSSLAGYVGIESYGRSVRPILTFAHRYHLLAIGSESRQPVTLNYMARYMLSDLSFDDYLRAGGWRGYAQKAAKNAFVTEARSWLAPLQQMLARCYGALTSLEVGTDCSEKIKGSI